MRGVGEDEGHVTIDGFEEHVADQVVIQWVRGMGSALRLNATSGDRVFVIRANLGRTGRQDSARDQVSVPYQRNRHKLKIGQMVLRTNARRSEVTVQLEDGFVESAMDQRAGGPQRHG